MMKAMKDTARAGKASVSRFGFMIIRKLKGTLGGGSGAEAVTTFPFQRLEILPTYAFSSSSRSLEVNSKYTLSTLIPSGI